MLPLRGHHWPERRVLSVGQRPSSRGSAACTVCILNDQAVPGQGKSWAHSRQRSTGNVWRKHAKYGNASGARTYHSRAVGVVVTHEHALTQYDG